MDKAGESLASSSLALPLATLCVLTALKVKVLCWIASLHSLNLAPPTATRFTSLLTDPAPPPLLPTFPDTQPLTPILPPPNQAQGGLVMQLECMFFIWTLPHTSVPVDPLYPTTQ